mmetsp:Transcript_24387/g.61900  ORF Transcript_24387/g.61900 Transcript_24387/m.61900 type:complete len:587 (+) Transcript_24387:1120-2880(+)
MLKHLGVVVHIRQLVVRRRLALLAAVLLHQLEVPLRHLHRVLGLPLGHVQVRQHLAGVALAPHVAHILVQVPGLLRLPEGLVHLVLLGVARGGDKQRAGLTALVLGLREEGARVVELRQGLLVLALHEVQEGQVVHRRGLVHLVLQLLRQRHDVLHEVHGLAPLLLNNVAEHLHVQHVDLEALVTHLLDDRHALLAGVHGLVGRLHREVRVGKDLVAVDLLALVADLLEALDALLGRLHRLLRLVLGRERVHHGEQRGRLPALAVLQVAEERQRLPGHGQGAQGLVVLEVHLGHHGELDGLELLDAQITEHAQHLLHLAQRIREAALQDAGDGNAVQRARVALLVLDALEELARLGGHLGNLLGALLARVDVRKLEKGGGDHLLVLHLAEAGERLLAHGLRLLQLRGARAAPVAHALGEGELHGRLAALVAIGLELGKLLVGYPLGLLRLVLEGKGGLHPMRVDDDAKRVVHRVLVARLAEDCQRLHGGLQRLGPLLVVQVALGGGEEHRSLPLLHLLRTVVRERRVVGRQVVMLVVQWVLDPVVLRPAAVLQCACRSSRSNRRHCARVLARKIVAARAFWRHTRS